MCLLDQDTCCVYTQHVYILYNISYIRIQKISFCEPLDVANSLFSEVLNNLRLEAASPATLPTDPSERVRRLLVATNSTAEHVRALHLALVRKIHPDKCKDAWLHLQVCPHAL